ncbi:MAG: histidinol phosphate phosphatase domain-containing protein [Desulfohalobiaceae bacterium]
MIDLHTHTLFSDGALIPAELARRARVAGYQGLAITDHADQSNMPWILERLQPGVAELSRAAGLQLLAGIELTHVPPEQIAGLVGQAREFGAYPILVHGETLVEPVAPGTNLAAIEAGVDILAHPGLITEEEARLAAAKGVALEISTRKGHCLSNGHVAALALSLGCRLIINNDAHEPGDLIPEELRARIGLGSGLSQEQYQQAEAASRDILLAGAYLER